MEDIKYSIYFLCTVLYVLYQPAALTVLKGILDFECKVGPMMAES